MAESLAGPDLAETVAARMPGWRPEPWVRGGWRDHHGDFRYTGQRTHPACHSRFFPDCDVRDAIEVVEALGLVVVIGAVDVYCFPFPNVLLAPWTVIPREGRTLAQAVCAAVCGVAVQMPTKEGMA